MKLKGQIWSLDLSVSAIAFLAVLIAVLFAWTYASNEAGSGLELRRMETRAVDISEALVATSGVPADWSAADVKTIGLALSEGVLNATKVATLAGLSYEEARLKVGAGVYHFHFRVKDGNNNTLQLGGVTAEAGAYPTNATVVIPVERYVSANGTPVVMEFLLWN